MVKTSSRTEARSSPALLPPVLNGEDRRSRPPKAAHHRTIPPGVRREESLDEPVPAVHFAACCHHAFDGRRAAGRFCCLSPASGLRTSSIDYPTIQIQTFYPGASPDVMASSVTAPLERQFGQIPGLN